MAKHDKNGEAPKNDGQKRRRGRPPLPGPTARQREMLDFIRAASQADRRPPSIEEIRRHFQFRSTNAVRTHLLALEKKGLVRIARNSHRGISLVNGGRGVHPNARLVPLLGDAPAGLPAEAVEQADEHVAVDAALFPHADIFAIAVRGDSMRDAGILDRDVALIRPGSEAGDGDLVLARLNREVTVKRLRLRAGKGLLHPENPDYPDIPIRKHDDFAILGKVMGIVRKY